MTDSTGAVVWSAYYKPFGAATITVSTITNNLRFPGQYYDAETGLHQNWNRDYNSSNGRYLEADPFLLSLFYQGKILFVPPYITKNPSLIPVYLYGVNNPTKYFNSNGYKAAQCNPCPYGNQPWVACIFLCDTMCNVAFDIEAPPITIICMITCHAGCESQKCEK